MSRYQACKILLKLFEEKKSLSELKTDIQKIPLDDRPLVQELCYGVARWYFRLHFIADTYLKKPLKRKDFDIYILILIGLYQILFTRIPDHAALSETVNAARKLNKEWATKLINAVLRSFLKNQTMMMEKIRANEEANFAHPEWMIKKIKSAWPSWEKVLETNNEYPPFCLRVNEQKITRENYLSELTSMKIHVENIPWTQSGILLKEAVDLSCLPHFNEGYVSVQDGAAQLAAQLLEPQKDDLVLDACAAPGGKASHILELQPKVKNLVAIDNDANRIQKIEENLGRLKLKATVICHDVMDLSWWQGMPFDKILLDVPCSASGVIRRHPDIKILRESSDIPKLTEIQYQILEKLWQVLKVGGTLLYVTCSIFPDENEKILSRFMANYSNCHEEVISAEWGVKLSVGRQILPGMYSGMDGFYFAKLRRS